MKTFITTGPLGPIECVVNECKNTSAPVLVMAHGFRGSRDGGGRAIVLANEASRYATVVRFNFNGSQILSRQVAELRAVLGEIRRRYANRQVLLLGRSLGGAAALIMAGCDADVAGLILWATPNDLRATFKTALGDAAYAQLDSGVTLHLSDERGELALTPDFLTDLDQYDLSAVLQKWNGRTILILHGDADETVCVKQAQRYFALLADDVDKELHIFSGGDHSFTTCSGEANAIICRWLEKHFIK